MYIVYNSKIMIQTGGNGFGTYDVEKIQINSNQTVKFIIKPNMKIINIKDSNQLYQDISGVKYLFKDKDTNEMFKFMNKKTEFFEMSLNNGNVTFTKKKDAKPECTLCMGINNLGTKETTVKNLLYKKGDTYESLDNDEFIPYLLEKFNKHREFGEFIIAVYVLDLIKGKEGGQSRQSRQSRHNRQDAKPKRRTIKKEKRKK